MKRVKIGWAILFVQLLAIGVLLLVPHLQVSHAVRWQQQGNYTLTAKYVRGSQADKDALNQEIAAYLDTFDCYYEQDILHFNHIRVLASEPHVSVVEIRTELMHNATTESGGAYLPAGEKTVELWVYADGDSVKTNWVTVENTISTD